MFANCPRARNWSALERLLKFVGYGHECHGADYSIALAEFSQLDVPQAQRIRDHRNRAERHGGAGDNRAEQQAEERVEHAGGDRHAQRVVDETRKKDSGGCCAWWRG